MSANVSVSGPAGGGLDGVNATVHGNGTDDVASPPLTALGLLQNADFVMLELKLLVGAMGIIYLGAHGALRRPPSASPSKPKEEGEDDEDEDDRFSQGLELTDAIMFPLMAGAILAGLYYLIQWLKDPAILNKILRWYMSTVSIASLLSLYAHGMEVATSFVFPRYWRGPDGALRKVDQKARLVARCDEVGNVVEGAPPESGLFPRLPVVRTLEGRAKSAAWDLRALLTRRWVFKLFIHGLVGEHKARVKFAHMMAFLLATATALVYFSTSSPLLSNMLGYGMCYGSFLILSPTDFLIGSLVLVGLFFYDIYMVFFTQVPPMPPPKL
ncbi:hypothetical protein RJ55_01828 [Drechmeria coniospora]|nr:hypothetical protein RJ55_01828 [Drechmeria coniospora]